MIRLSIAVQAHPDRTPSATALAEEIGGQVVWDPEPTAPIRSPWRTYRHALEQTPPDATHRLVVQDDAVVCRGFRAAAEAAVAARPDRLILFFVGGNPYPHARAVLNACARDEPWAELGYGHWCPVVANCWPVGLAAEMLAFNEAQRWPERFTSDDERTGRFIREMQHRPLATVPSLVEHPDNVQSLIGRRNRGGLDPGRIAACWIGACDECDDATLIDWTRGPGG